MSEALHQRRTVSVVIPVYRDAQRAIELVRTFLAMEADARHLHEIIVIDDGSGDGSADILRQAIGDRSKVIALPANTGRSAARNAGAESASGDLLYFIDCDCLPCSPGVLLAHLAEWHEGVVATIGPVMGDGTGFWHRYQSEASERRRRQHAAGLLYSGSSQNLMVHRQAFQDCGGFDIEYRTYGFEDRDLQIRLMAYGTIRWAKAGGVKHMDRLSMVSVSRKMTEAGRGSASRFRTIHPEAYRRLGYARMDAHQKPWLRPLAAICAWSSPASARLIDHMLNPWWIPYAIKRLMVRTATAASYLAGCRPG